MKLSHIAAFLMLLGALGCQPSDSSSPDDGAVEPAATESETTADADPVTHEELKTVSFTVTGMK